MRIRVQTTGLAALAAGALAAGAAADPVVTEMVERPVSAASDAASSQAEPAVRFDIAPSESIAWSYTPPFVRRGGSGSDAIIRFSDEVQRRPVQMELVAGPRVSAATVTVPISGAGGGLSGGGGGGAGGGAGLAQVFASDARSIDRDAVVELETLEIPEVETDPWLSDLFVAIKSREQLEGTQTVGTGRKAPTITPDMLVVPIPGALGMGLVGLAALGVVTVRRRLLG
ncbi:MAG: hypothetical protein AB8G96_12270 [Phycisphaerales bacterium]